MVLVFMLLILHPSIIERTAADVLRQRQDDVTPEALQRTEAILVRLFKFWGIPLCSFGLVRSLAKLVLALLGK